MNSIEYTILCLNTISWPCSVSLQQKQTIDFQVCTKFLTLIFQDFPIVILSKQLGKTDTFLHWKWCLISAPN